MALVLAAASWLAWVAVATPWRAKLPRASAEAVAAWPELESDRRSGLRLVHAAILLRPLGTAAVLAAMVAPPVAQRFAVLGRASDLGAGFAVGVALAFARIPVWILVFVGARRLARGSRMSAGVWTWRAARGMLLCILGAVSAGTAIDVMQLQPEPGRIALMGVTVAVLGCMVVVACAVAPSDRLVKSQAELEPRLRDLADALASQAGIRRPFRIVIGTARGVDEIGGALGGRRPVVVIRPASARQADVAGVLAHELAHVKYRDPIWLAIQRALTLLTSLFAAIAAISAPFLRELVHAGRSATGALIPLALAAGLAAFGTLRSINLATSRRREARADLAALAWLPPDGAARAIRRYSRKVSYPARWSWWQLLLFADHPDLVDRARMSDTGRYPVWWSSDRPRHAPPERAVRVLRGSPSYAGPAQAGAGARGCIRPVGRRQRPAPPARRLRCSSPGSPPSGCIAGRRHNGRGGLAGVSEPRRPKPGGPPPVALGRKPTRAGSRGRSEPLATV
jgi:Zn-dependent protease with chaperone function